MLVAKILYIVCYLALHSHCKPNSQEESNNKNIKEFLRLLLNNDHPDCTIMFFQDKHDNSDILNHLVLNTNYINYFNVKFPYPIKPKHLSNDAFANQSLVDQIKYYTNDLPVTFPITVSNYHRRSDQCIVSILMIEDLRPKFMSRIYDVLTPVYIPITRKDLDYYVFVTKPDLTEPLLLMKELPSRIKYKIAIAEDPVKNGLMVKTMCFFCGEMGSPVAVNYPSEYTPGWEYFPDMVDNLNGKLLRISSAYIRGRVEAGDPPWKGVNNARRGVVKHCLEEYLMVKFNFTYNMFVSTGIDGNFGGGGTGLQLQNGTWIGVTGDIIMGKADLGVVTTNTPKRIQYIDFTESFLHFDFLTFVTSEGERVFSPLALLWPFDALMWFCLFLSTLLAFAFFALMIKSIYWLNLGDLDSLKFARRGQKSDQTWSFKYQIQFVITSYLDQDCVLPIFTPLRTFVAIWLFFTLVVTTIYRSKLVSLLAFPIISQIPTDFDQLAYSDYQVGFMKHGDSAYNTLAASTDPVYVKLVKEMEIINGVGLECLEKVVTMKYGCIAYEFAIRHLQERNLSDAETRKLVIAPSHSYTVAFGIATEGKSIYRINFSKYLSYTRSFGLSDRWDKTDLYQYVRLLKREWWISINQTDKLHHVEEDAGDNLTFKHISGSFYILFTLLTICTVVFFGEFLHYYRIEMSYKLRKWVNLGLTYTKKVRNFISTLCPTT